MKLRIGSKPIALTEGTKISIERSSPLLNDDTGSFSFPFPVPTLPNQQVLGWPGRLERSGNIPDQSFILEDSGLQVFRGEVEYDDITVNEIGLILKSGYTEFTKKMEGKKLGDFDYGSEAWPASDDYYVTMPKIFDKLVEWNTANTINNGKYVLSPFWINPYSSTNPILVNDQLWNGTDPSSLNIDYNPGTTTYTYGLFCLQFKVSFVLRKIFENAGYVIMEDGYSESEFNKAIFYGKVMSVGLRGLSGGHATLDPVLASLQYSTLMPDVEILDFLRTIKDMFCLMYEINELKKEIRIKFKKDIFLPENLDAMKIDELAGWTHKEERAQKGFSLKYSSQASDQDTKYDYKITASVPNTLPTPKTEGQVYHITDYNRDFVVEKNSLDVLEWQEIGRLKERREGDGENAVEVVVTVPVQKEYTFNNTKLECPSLLDITKSGDSYLSPVTFLSITLYHGRKPFGSTSFPYASFDRFSINGLIDTGMSLKPAYLYDTVYSEFLNWQTYKARAFTKYLALSLLQLLALQWGKRYMINGVVVIFDKLNYELPYSGQIEAIGCTA